MIVTAIRSALRKNQMTDPFSRRFFKGCYSHPRSSERSGKERALLGLEREGEQSGAPVRLCHRFTARPTLFPSPLSLKKLFLSFPPIDNWDRVGKREYAIRAKNCLSKDRKTVLRL
jgi:hypothetical protein